MSKGPVINPLLIVSLIVIVKRGPAIRTPEKANTNEMPPIVAKDKIIRDGKPFQDSSSKS